MDNTIIECSRFDAIDATSNASWITTIPKGVTINNGDIITLRNCFINSGTSDVENIEIIEDLTLQFVVGYYDVNYADDVTEIGANGIDYDYYIAYNQNLGSVATLTSVSFRGLYSQTPAEDIVVALVTFKDVSGKSYSLNWGGYDEKKATQPIVYYPRPPVGNHSNVTVNLNIPNVVVSSISGDGQDGTVYMGAQWAGMGQYGLSLNTGSVEIIIPSGEYTRTGLAKFITDKLQFAPPLYADDEIEIGNDMMRRTDQGENHLGIQDASVDDLDDQHVILLTELFDDEDAVFATGLTFGTHVIVEYTLFDDNGQATGKEVKSAIVDTDANGGIIIDGNGEVIISFTTNIFDIGDNYGLGVLIIDTGDDNLTFKRIGFDPNDAGTKNYTYNIPAYYGSSENVLIYDEDRSVFAWQYLHMPYYGQNPPTICIKQLKNTVQTNPEAYNKFYTVTQLGGVFFLDLSPVSFWESLGFNMDQLIVPIQPNKMINRADLSNRITYGYSSLGSLLDLTNPKEIQTALNEDIATTDTRQIIGSSLDDISTGGFYLVSVNFGSQNYMFQKGNKNSIQAIVSKYNQIRDYITGYSDASIGYQHVGVSFDLQSVIVDILDPQTKKPDTTIGDKSTIFIQITRNPETQINKSKK